MQVIVLPTSEDVALYAAGNVIEAITKKADAVLGLATGSTPIALYRQLVQRNQAGLVAFKDVKTFNLDEYIGIPETHAQSYRSFMNQHLFERVDIDINNTYVPKAESLDPDVLAESARDYESKITSAGGVDIQILGIGINGHIGFNEPTSSFASKTRIKTLSQSTIEANKRFFADDEFQPQLAMTMGIGTILNSREIMLMATGTNKARAVRDMIEGPIASICPASILQQHQHVTIVLDEEAACLLALKDYYIWCEQKRSQLHEGTLI